MTVALLTAWKAWDDWCLRYSKLYRDAAQRGHLPSKESVAALGREGEKPTFDLETFCKAVAEAHGLTTSELRNRLSAARREGASCEQALAMALRG